MKNMNNQISLEEYKKKKEEKNNDNKFRMSHTIKLMEKSMRDLKIKGFKEALGEALRYLFYVNYAIVNHEVEKAPNFFENSTRMYQALSPTFLSMASSFGGTDNFKTGLAFTMVNLFLNAYRTLKKEQQINAAQRIVDAFVGTYNRIDVEKMKAIVKHMALRYDEQIDQMTISISTRGKLRMSEKDGIVVFANVIAQRIGSHIIQDKNFYIEQDKIPFLQNIQNVKHKLFVGYQTFFGEAQNVKARIQCSTLARCVYATWQQVDGYEIPIEFDKIEEGEYVTWPAGTILTHTGIRLIGNSNFVCERKDYFEPKLGRINAYQSEATERKYEKSYNVQDKKLEEHKILESNFNQTELPKQYINSKN